LTFQDYHINNGTDSQNSGFDVTMLADRLMR